MSGESILLIDVSGIVHSYFHLSGAEPDPNFTSTMAVAKCHALATEFPYVGIATDSRTSWRKELTPTYKANRVKLDQPILHQLSLTEEILARDGFPVWKAEGFEADDLVASACLAAAEHGVEKIRIASSDKDLVALVNNDFGISVQSLRDNQVYDEAAVEAKFGIPPSAIRDYLTLTGDTADNIEGVKGIGPKRATELLQRFKSIEGIIAAMDANHVDLDGITPTMRTNIRAAIESGTLALGSQLVTLRTDVPIPFESIFKPRVSQQSEAAMSDDLHTDEEMREMMPTLPIEPPPVEVDKATGEILNDPPAPPAPTPTLVGKPVTATVAPESMQALAKRPEIVGNGMPWEKQLEPRHLDDARVIAKWVHGSRLFANYGSPEAIFSVVLAGRELGLGTMASLRAFHVVLGRPMMAADFLRGLVLSSGKAEYFRCDERTPTQSTWTTKRSGDPQPTTLTYTLDEAKIAGLVTPNSGWTKHVSDMLAKTASSKLARLVYPDITYGLYAPAELGADEL